MSAISEALRAAAREVRLTGLATLATGVERALGAGDILSLTVTEGADGALLPGAVLSASYVLKVDNADRAWDRPGAVGGTVSLSLGVRLPDRSWGESPLGVFVIEEARSPEGESVATLTGSDAVASELSGELTDALAYPATLSAVWAHLVSRTRFSFSGEAPSGGAIVDAAPDWQGMPLRRAMGMAAAAAGCFVRVNREGALELRRVWDASRQAFSLSPSAYWDLTGAGASFGPLNCLRVTAEKGEADEAAEVVVRTDASVPDSVLNTLSMKDNPLFVTGAEHLESMVAGMLSEISGMAQTGMTLAWRGDPALSVGDWLLVTDTRGATRAGIVTGQTLSFDRGFSARLTCALPAAGAGGLSRAITPEGGVNADRLVGTVDGALIAAESVTARTIAAGSITAEKLAAGAVDAQALSAVTARLETVLAGEITTDALYAAIAGIVALRVGQIDAGAVNADALFAALANIVSLAVGGITADNIETDALAAVLGEFVALYADWAGIDFAAIRDLVTDTAIIARGTADELYIARLCVTEGNIASLSVGELLLTGADGALYSLTVDDAGNVSATRRMIGGADIGEGALDANVLVPGSITADRLNVREIFASSALVGAVKAANIDAAELFASEAFLARLNAWDIWANDFMRLSVKKADLELYLRLDADRGAVIIGKNTSDVNVEIDDQGMRVRDGGVAVATYAGNEMRVTDGTFTQSLRIGGFAFKPGEDGGFSLLKR